LDANKKERIIQVSGKSLRGTCEEDAGEEKNIRKGLNQ
jgi:hypothetical protein